MVNKTKLEVLKETKFLVGLTKDSKIDKTLVSMTQIAFWGKSNVGKSSLINSICRTKKLVKVSSTPGKTKQINFFTVAEKLLIADFPGYGFAKVSLEEKSSWKILISHYLQNSPNLKLVNLLIDARTGIKKNDLEAIKMLNLYGKQIQLVFTKTDKINSKSYLKIVPRNFFLKFKPLLSEIILSSTKNNTGIKALQKKLLQYLK